MIGMTEAYPASVGGKPAIRYVTRVAFGCLQHIDVRNCRRGLWRTVAQRKIRCIFLIDSCGS
jgi:hypothetical protein